MALLAVALASSPSPAAPAGILTGQISAQETHEPLPGALVRLLNGNLEAITDSSGRYVIRGIETGYYNISITRQSYRPVLKNRVIVKAGIPTVLDVAMTVKPIVLSGVVVRPTYFEKPSGAVASSQRMDFEEIATQPGGYFDVQRAIQALPSVMAGADQNNEIVVRGGNVGENLFVVDNIEVPNPNHFTSQGASGGAVSVINTDFIRQVDFIAGAFPARYGNKASSVLDIGLREGAADAFHAKGELGMSGVSATVEGPARHSATYLAGFRRSYFSFIKSRFGITATPHFINLQGKLAYAIDPRHKLILLGIYAADDYRLDLTGAQREDYQHSVDYRSWQYTGGAVLQTLYDAGFITHTLSTTGSHWRQNEADTLANPTYSKSSSEAESSYKLDAYFKSPGAGALSVGMDVRTTRAINDLWMKPDTLYRYDPYTGQLLEATCYVYDLRIKPLPSAWRYGGYAQLERDLGRIATLRAGTRADYIAYTGQMTVSPRAGAGFHLAPGTDLTLAYGRCYQPPEWFQIGLDTANRRLRAKYADHYVAGFEQIFAEDIRGTLEAYYKAYRSVAVPHALTTADPYDRDNVYVNAGQGDARGVEVFLQKKVKRNLWGTISYSYSVARMNDPRYPGVWYDWDFDLRHIFTAIAGYREDFKRFAWYRAFRSRWWYPTAAVLPVVPADESELSLRFRYLGGKPYTPLIMHPEMKMWQLDPQLSINTERADPYARLDLHVQRRWFLGGVNLSTYLEVENVLNYPNIWDYQYVNSGKRKPVYQYGRTLIAGVTFEI